MSHKKDASLIWVKLLIKDVVKPRLECILNVTRQLILYDRLIHRRLIARDIVQQTKNARVQPPTINLRFTLHLLDLKLCTLSNFPCVCRLQTFSKSYFSQKKIRNAIRVSINLDTDQVIRFVRPDLGQNCLQRVPVNDSR